VLLASGADKEGTLEGRAPGVGGLPHDAVLRGLPAASADL